MDQLWNVFIQYFFFYFRNSKTSVLGFLDILLEDESITGHIHTNKFGI